MTTGAGDFFCGSTLLILTITNMSILLYFLYISDVVYLFECGFILLSLSEERNSQQVVLN